MAEFEQDLIIFEDDTLLLRYTFTDLAVPLTSGMGFWWGAVTSSGFPNTEGSLPNCSAHNVWSAPAELMTSTGNITVDAPDIVNIQFNQNMFEDQGGYASGSLETDKEYYTELVFSPSSNQSLSVVAATGKLFISSSMFSIAGYRP
tara:strand:- start:518 stop:955 length:438 start_codon:yes stop_codon:yes gene_type:complete